MTASLNYASTPTDRHWSRMAFVSLTASILQVPLFFAIFYLFLWLHVQGNAFLAILLAVLLINAALTAVLAVCATVRVFASGGRLRGWSLALIALIIPPIWLIAILWYTLGLLPRC